MISSVFWAEEKKISTECETKQGIGRVMPRSPANESTICIEPLSHNMYLYISFRRAYPLEFCVCFFFFSLAFLLACTNTHSSFTYSILWNWLSLLLCYCTATATAAVVCHGIIWIVMLLLLYACKTFQNSYIFIKYVCFFFWSHNVSCTWKQCCFFLSIYWKIRRCVISNLFHNLVFKLSILYVVHILYCFFD